MWFLADSTCPVTAAFTRHLPIRPSEGLYAQNLPNDMIEGSLRTDDGISSRMASMQEPHETTHRLSCCGILKPFPDSFFWHLHCSVCGQLGVRHVCDSSPCHVALPKMRQSVFQEGLVSQELLYRLLRSLWITEIRALTPSPPKVFG
jgi:hypothetical protein